MLTPPIRSKSSADGGTEVDLAAGVVFDWLLPNRSAPGCDGPELEAGGFPEKEFQSPNSPFPPDGTAANNKTVTADLCLF